MSQAFLQHLGMQAQPIVEMLRPLYNLLRKQALLDPCSKALGIYSHLLMCTESRRQQCRLKGFSSWRQSRGI